MDEALQVAGTVVSHLTPPQFFVLILALPFLLAGFVLFMSLRRRLGLVDEPPGREGAQDLVERTSKLLDTMLAELSRSQALLHGYIRELDALRTARVFLFLRNQQLMDAALAARVLVRELERKCGLPETRFPPLPDVPDSTGPPQP